MTLTALIEGIRDKARKSDKKAKRGRVHYRRKSDKKSKGKSREKSKKGKLCKDCKNPNAYHDPEDCFVTNKKLRKEWERKNGRAHSCRMSLANQSKRARS